MQNSDLFEEEEYQVFFVDIILPVPIPKLFTYRVPKEMNESIQLGMRVIVQFGRSKVLTAIIGKIHQNPPEKYKAKYLLDLLDEVPMVTSYQLQLFEWMATYYMCNIGEVMNVALPSGLKISSQSKIQLRPDAQVISESLDDKEKLLITALESGKALSYNEAAEATNIRNVYQVIKSLIAKELVLVFEEIKEKYQPKVIKKIRFKRIYLDRIALNNLCQSLEKRPKQLDIILNYLRQVPVLQDITLNAKGLDKKTFLQSPQTSASSLKTLIKNEVFEEFEVTISRFEDYELANPQKIKLSPAQQTAFDDIIKNFQNKDVTLLQGVTGSGKTEIYIQLIQTVLDSGSQVLLLLPEIALTTQIVSRLKKVFGGKMGVYHSKFSDNERVEVWQGIITGKFNFVVAVRSGIFLPFDNLGLIIVDEEHESSYKQHDPAPRYNARDMAIVISKLQNSKVLLGSATPSVESFYNAKQDKYALAQLTERYGNATLPEITLADLRIARKDKTLKGHFTNELIEQMQARLDKKEQVILFQNRRGYSPYVTCKECSWIPYCKSCDVSLTYHLHSDELKCHYCGYQDVPPKRCPNCGSTKITTVGLGTEKIEDDLKLLLPEARLQRMDLDTTRKKNAYQQILQDFENHDIDVLIGTQMVSKGLDFDKVSLVGIFGTDRMLNFPDFRATERAFQMLTQVSGRAGRKNQKGKVIIQTANPQQDILKKVIENNYEAVYNTEIEDRAYFFYPPFTRLIRLVIKHQDRFKSEKTAKTLADKLIEKLGRARVLGPEPPLINKIRDKYLFHILIKIEKEKVNLRAVKAFIQDQIDEVLVIREFKQSKIVVDVDPS